MPISAAQIDLWRSEQESERLEFKEAKNNFDYRELLRYCVALANEGGGNLVLGIQDVTPRTVVGTKSCENPLGMAERLFGKLGFRVDIEVVQHRDGRVVVYQIPGRPRGTAFHLEGAYLMRSGAALVPMSEDHLRKIFAEAKPDWLEEPSMTGVGASSVIELLDVPTFFSLLRLPPPTSPDTALDRLLSERLIDQESAGTFAIRRLGALLLAYDLASFPDLTRKAPRVISYDGSSKLDVTKIDRTGRKGYATGFQSLVRFIDSHLPQNQAIKDALRTEIKLVPEIATRELVANALIHQDLTIGGSSVMIEIFSNRMEISNPGEPIVPVERFIDGYQ